MTFAIRKTTIDDVFLLFLVFSARKTENSHHLIVFGRKIIYRMRLEELKSKSEKG